MISSLTSWGGRIRVTNAFWPKLLHNAPSVSIEPNNCLADQDLRIRISDLQPHQKVTVQAQISRSDTGIFESFAKYTSCRNGVVDLTSQASLGGSYCGVDRMGLFWSMKPSSQNKQPRDRFIVRDVENPVEVIIRIFDNHIDSQNLVDGQEALVKASAKRWFKSPGVRRIPVRWKRVRGTLFVPEGVGPFPAVIDLYGTIGGLPEYRAALLASRGCMCLALAFFDYDDLPKTLSDVDLGYFDEAKEFLEAQPEVQRNGVGIVGSSYGGTLALACTTYIEGFKCCVSVNSPLFAFIKSIHYKGRTWDGKSLNFERMYKDNGALVTKHTLDYFDTELVGSSLIEFAQSDKSFLFVFGEDDMAYDARKAITFTEQLVRGGKGNYKIVSYPETGHLIEPPHIPYSGSTYVKILNGRQSWGGNPKMHARAQVRSWQEILGFFKQHLG